MTDAHDHDHTTDDVYPITIEEQHKEIAAFPDWSAQHQQAISGILGRYYEEAQAAGDEERMAELIEVHSRITHMNDMQKKQMAFIGALRAWGLSMQQTRDEVLNELEVIEMELCDPDEASHPLVKFALDWIRESEASAALDHYDGRFEEWKKEEFDRLADDALEYADEAAADALDEQLSGVLDISTFEARDIADMLRGFGYDTINDEEARKLLELFNQIQQRNQRERMKARAARSQGVTDD